MLTYYTPNMPECMGDTDSTSIQNAIRSAKESGVDTVLIPRMNARTKKPYWTIEKAILLPSDIHIMLEGCHLIQAEGCFDNVFRNENMYTEGSGTVTGEQKNIRITGIGNALIDGGIHNGLTERNSCKDGMPHISCNNMILLHNVDGFAIRNITFKDQRWWAINLIYVTNGSLSDITIDARDNVPNQDGIDLRTGCHNITVENVYGQAGDDLVALSGFCGEARRGLAVEGKSPDIFNVTIRNVVGTSVTKAVVALRNHDEIKLHDITVDGVTDTSGDGRGNKPYAVVRIGQKTYSKLRASLLGETARIFVKNIHASHGDAVLANVTLADSRIEGIFCSKDARSAFSTRTDWSRALPGIAMKNVTVDGIYCDAESPAESPLIELIRAEETDGMDGVAFRNVFAPGGKTLIYSEYEGGYTVNE